ncbi:MAG: hypothetical protein QNK05_10070 [Myxococcota bacterium]|nr:hypothetical protein [Myxococcota bacterium]
MGFASRRFVPHIALLIVALAIPTLLHSQGGFRMEDCDDVDAIFPQRSDPMWDSFWDGDRRKRGFDNATRDGGAWAEGSQLMPGGTRVNWLIVRSYDPKRIYHRPARNLVEGGQIGALEIERVEAGELTIPIRWLRYETGVSQVQRRVAAGHVLVYGGRPIENPYMAQLLSAPMQLFLGRMPMTLYLAYARVESAEVERAGADVRDFLKQAVARYPEACG